MPSLNQDTNGVYTAQEYGDTGVGVSKWFGWWRTADGGDATQGLKADAAVTDPTTSATVVSILKGLLTALRLSAAGLLKAEDAVHASGDSGVMMLAVRKDTATAVAADGDYIPIIVDGSGKLHVAGTYAEDAVAASGDVAQAILYVRNDALASKTNTDGDWSIPATGPAGEQFFTPSASATVAGTAPTNATVSAYATSLVVKASAGVLFGLSGYNSAVGAVFIQIHDASSLPADTAVPAVVIAVAGASTFSIDFGVYGRKFTTGITVVSSSTGPTKTITSATAWIDAQYK